MFYNDAINKNKLNKVTTPVDLEEYPINPRDYDYAIDFAGNIQDAKGCTPTIDSIQPFEIDGNNQNTIQNDVLLIPPQSDGSEISPKKTIRFDGHLEASKKTFKNYHTKRAYHSWGLHKFQGVLRYPFEPWPANQPLTFNHIQMASKNDKKEINLIYAPTFDKQFHSLSMTNHSLSIIFNSFLAIGNDKFYLHILYVYIHISYLIYILYGFMVLISALAQRGWFGRVRPSNMYI